jgi:hypothetical protein
MTSLFSDAIAPYIGCSSTEIDRLLSLPQGQIYADDTYCTWTNNLDYESLYETLPDARSAYEAQLPQFSKVLIEHYGVSNERMSAYTLGNWLVGFLQTPDQISKLPKIHQHLPRAAVLELLPGMIGMLDSMGTGREQWQRALAILALPLAVGS